MKKTDLAYFAGIVDGEGCIVIMRSKRQHSTARSPSFCALLTVTSTDEWLPHQLRFAFGGTVYLLAPRTNHRKTWRWDIASKQAMSCLQALLPYLRLKHEQARIAITLETSIHPKRSPKPLTEEELAFREAQRILIHNLNQRKGPHA